MHTFYKISVCKITKVTFVLPEVMAPVWLLVPGS